MARRDGFRSTSARIGAALGVACVVLGASATDEAPSTRVIPGMRHENEFQSFLEKYSKKYCDGATVEEACEASLRRQKVYYANIVRYDAHKSCWLCTRPTTFPYPLGGFRHVNSGVSESFCPLPAS